MILLKLFSEKDRNLPKSSYKSSISLITNLDKNATKKETYRPIFMMNTDKKFSTKC